MTETIEQQSIIGGTPGGSTNRAPAPTPGEVVTITADASREYASATGTAFYGNYWRALRWAIDDLTEEFGDDLYERMLRDPQVLACLNVMKTGVLEDGILLRPAVPSEDDPRFDQAQALVSLCTAMFEQLLPSIDDVLWDLLDGLALGCKVAEATWWEYGQGPDPKLPWIRSVKVKPRTATSFVVDVYSNVVGMLARIPGVGTPVQAGTLLMSGQEPYNMLPREKFVVFTFRPKDNDPRGRSILRASYTAWWLKMQTWPQYLKFLTQFGTPSLIGFVGEGAQTVTFPGQPQKSPEQVMVDTLIAFQNGTAAAFENGAKVQVIDVGKTGVDAFVKAFDLYDRQITTGILHQTLATMEGQHQARAASETHMGVLITMIRQVKRAVGRMVRNDMLRPWVRAMFGPEMEALTPYVTLGRVDKDRVAELWNAAANLGYYLDPTQFPGMDELLGVPVRDPETLKKPDEQENDAEESDEEREDEEGDPESDEEEEEGDQDDNAKNTTPAS